MKRKRIIIITSILCPMLAFVQAALVASNGWIPPQSRETVLISNSYECHISVNPSVPTITDTIQIAAFGEWPDSCIPAYTSHQVVSHEVRIDFVHDFVPICLPVVMGWGHTIEISNLTQGDYEITAYINNYPCGSRTFVVFGRVIPLYLPIITK
jgi:hypothetical protein